MKYIFYSMLMLQWVMVQHAAQQPNILLIVSEDNGPELGCYGDPYARTPNLDRLADEGIRFNRAYVPQAGCSQSRASFLTGLYPHQHGQIGLATWGFRLYRKDLPNLPRLLKANGYRTGLIGKLHINPSSVFDFDMHRISGANFQRKQLSDYARFAADFMKQSKVPFFLSVNFPDPHDPWIRQVNGLPKHPQTGKDVKAMPYLGIDPPEWREMIADYYNSISRMDTLVGNLLSALEVSGKARDTIVIYLGDHGADMFRAKRTSYEGGLRIPLLLRWPNHVKPQIREELVSTIDVMPTLLRAAGLHAGATLPGRPLQPLFGGGKPVWRQQLFSEYHTHGALNFFPQRAVRDNRFKLIENLLHGEPHPDYEATLRKMTGEVKNSSPEVVVDFQEVISNASDEVRTAYGRMQKPPRYELYDLQNDPFEWHNLANLPKFRTKLRSLEKTLISWRKQTRDPLLSEENLQRLKAEVRSVRSKREARKRQWKYPDYFFNHKDDRDPQGLDSF